jgi:hypothetical protein
MMAEPYALRILYPKVTGAIMRAENAEARGDPAARQAYLEVSRIEEEISTYLPTSDSQGALARRGAVRAAIFAADTERAKMLAERFSREPDASVGLRLDLKDILETTVPVLPASSASVGEVEERDSNDAQD